MKAEDVKIIVADESHIGYVDTILSTIEAAAKVRGTGIAKLCGAGLSGNLHRKRCILHCILGAGRLDRLGRAAHLHCEIQL